MRTLHKGLAMLLVVIMVLGLGAFTAVAAPTDVYADADQIDENYKEAVDVLTYIGVLEGDNGFRPTDTLTRAEGAKILTAVMGILNPTGTATSFTDVDDWAKGYVAYVEANGITDGVAENQFGSQMALTGSMFAKWLLVGLGYDAETEGMTGAPWEINIAKLVRFTGLDAGLEDYDPTKSITREQAAQMALNALKTPMVEYSNNITVNNGGSLVTIKGEAKKLESGASYASNISTAEGDNNMYLELGEQCWRNLKLTIEQDDLGRPTNAWSYGRETIGTYTSTSNLIFSYTQEVKKTDLYKAIGRVDYNDLTDDHPDYTSLKVFTDGVVNAKPTVGNYLDNSGNNGIGAGKDSPESGYGTCTELYRVENGNGIEYTLVIVHTYLVQATADYSETNKSVKVTSALDNGQNLQNVTEIKQSDFDVSDVVKDDYLLITVKKGGGNPKIQSVTPATMLTGEVEEYVKKDQKDSSVTLDGTRYSYNFVVGTGTAGYEADFSVGRNATVVLDDYGYVILVDEADAGADARYVYVKEAAYSLGLKARAYFLDGTTEDITVKRVGDATASASHGTDSDENYIGGKWYSYTTDSSGRYSLTNKTEDTLTRTEMTVSRKNNVMFLGDGVSYAGTDKTILLVLDGEDVYVYEGASNMPEITGTAKVSYVLDSTDSYIKYACIDGDGLTIKGAEKNGDLLFILDNENGRTGSDNKNNTYAMVNAVLNGEKKIDNNGVKVEAGYVNELTVGQLYTNLKYDDSGWIKEATPVGKPGADEFRAMGRSGAVKASGTTLTLADGEKAVDVSGANLNLIIAPETDGLNTKASVDTDNLSTSARQIERKLSEYEGSYDYWVVYTGSNTTKAKAVYIYARNGEPIGGSMSYSELESKLDRYTIVDFSGTVSSGDLLTVDEGQVLNIITDGSITLTNLTNNGTINVAGGTLKVTGTVKNYGTVIVTSGTLEAGTWEENSAQSLHLRKKGNTAPSVEITTLDVKGEGHVEIAVADNVVISELKVESSNGTVEIADEITIQKVTVNGTISVVGNDASLTVSEKLAGTGEITAASGADVTVTATDVSDDVTLPSGSFGGTITITAGFENYSSNSIGATPAAGDGGTYVISVDSSVTEITITTKAATSLNTESLQTSVSAAVEASEAEINATVDGTSIKFVIATAPTSKAWAISIDLTATT